MASQGDQISRISSSIRVIPDFPKPGIMFQDITTILVDPVVFKDSIDLFVERYKKKGIAVVAGSDRLGDKPLFVLVSSTCGDYIEVLRENLCTVEVS